MTTPFEDTGNKLRELLGQKLIDFDITGIFNPADITLIFEDGTRVEILPTDPANLFVNISKPESSK